MQYNHVVILNIHNIGSAGAAAVEFSLLIVVCHLSTFITMIWLDNDVLLTSVSNKWTSSFFCFEKNQDNKGAMYYNLITW